MIPLVSAFEWTGGYAPLDFGGPPPSARACAACHPQEAREWRSSGHATAWTNDRMLAGFVVEPLEFCVNCHAPRPDQRAEVLANLGWYTSLAPGSPTSPGGVERAPEPRAADGIDCAACHWRGGEVLAAEVSGVAAHRVTADPAFASGDLCLGCHEFPVPLTLDGVTTATAVPMQSTGSEWRAWVAAGGAQGCVDCHMPGGAHTFPGARDRAFLGASVVVEEGGGRLRLEARGVGHAVPTGDVFRRLTVEVAAAGGPWRVVDTVGLEFAVDVVDGAPRQRLERDTRLLPGVPREVPLPGDTARWRVTWHDAADGEGGLLDPADVTHVLAAGARGGDRR